MAGSRLVIPIVIALACALSGCRDSATATAPPSPAATPAPAAIEWRELHTWSGRGPKQTESFEVSMSAMRLRWRTMNETSPGAGRFTVTLHSAISGRPLQTIVDATGVASATVDVIDEPRWSHFVVDSSNVEWEMTLEQGYPAARATPDRD